MGPGIKGLYRVPRSGLQDGLENHCEWYNDLTCNKIRPDYFVTQKAKELFKGDTNLTDIEKVRTIYEYITNEISYSSIPFRQSGYVPQKASDVIITRMGDCKDVCGLFISLCRTVNIDANYVLVRTRENGSSEPPFPSIVFDHTLVKVNVDGEDYFLELTSEDMPFGALFSTSINALSLDIDVPATGECKPFHLNPANRIKNQIERSTTYELKEDKFNVLCETKKTGTEAAATRYLYKEKDSKKRQEGLTSSITNDKPSARIVSFDFEGQLSDQSDHVAYKYQYEYDADISRVSGLEIIRVPFTDQFLSYGFNLGNKRITPLELYNSLASTDEYHEELNINIPSGRKIAEKPSDISVKSDFVNLSIKVEEGAGFLKISRKVSVLKDRVPAEDFLSYRSILNEIIKSDTQVISFKQYP